MRRMLAAVLGMVAISAALRVSADWFVSAQADSSGNYGCVHVGSAATFPTGYSSKSSASIVCKALTKLEQLAKQTSSAAQAIVLPFQTTANSDGSHDTTYPNGDKPPVVTVGWNSTTLATLLAGVVSKNTGTATSINVTSACTGTNCGGATYALHTAVTNWTLSSAGVLANAGASTGSSPPALVLDVCYPVPTTCSSSASFNWAYVSAPGSDTTPPNEVTGIDGSCGASACTITFDPTTDPDDAVQRTGVATYRVKLNGTTVDTLAAAAGLTLDLTGGAIGVTTGSASQTAAPNGGKWTVTNNGGTGGGLESGQNTSIYAIVTPVSGATLCGRAGVASITTAATYGKAPVFFRNSNTSATAGELDVVVLLQAGTYYLQYNLRSTDGGAMITSAATALSGLPHAIAVCPGASTATIKYSYDGGKWTNAFSNIAVALNDSKYFGCGAAGTADGVNGVSTVVVYNYCDVVSSAQLSKTVTTATGGTWTVTAIDAQSPTANESTAAGSVSATTSGSSAAHKWNPGHYVRAHSHNLSCGTTCDAQRHSLYSSFSFGSDANIVGTEIWIDWKYLESDAGNDFVNVPNGGVNWLTNELAYVAANFPGKKVGLLLNFSPYGPSSVSQCSSWYPTYLCNAGCIYIEGSAGASGGSDSLNWFKNNSTCLGYFNRLMAAYGAIFDTNSTLAFVRIQQETDDAAGANGIGGAAEDAAWKNIALGSATAFPTTPIWIPVNWTGVNTAASVESLLLYWKSIQVGAGNGDTQPKDLAYGCPSTAWVCVVLGLNASIGGTNHSNCGEFVSMGSVELSEMGYNSVTDPFGGLTSQQVVTSWNSETCQQWGIWEPNFGEIGSSDTQYWNGAHGQKWAIDTIPLTHLSKPAGYQ